MAQEIIHFTKMQDLLLLREAVSVSPFKHGKGQGWKVIASHVDKCGFFSKTLKPKVVRERILFLMETFSSNDIELSTVENPETKEMYQLLQKLLELRDEAIEIISQSRSMISLEEPIMELDQKEHSANVNSSTVEVSAPEDKEVTTTKVSPTKRTKLQLTKKPATPQKGKRKQVMQDGEANLWKFMQEREEKRLKLREEEIALRREELEERKRLIGLLEKRLEDEKKIRENMFTVINGLLNK